MNRIECEELISASLDRVWAVVAEPGFWVPEQAGLAGTLAEEGETVVASNPQYGSFPVHVEKVTPPIYVAYHWASAFPGEALRDDNRTLVELSLTTEGDVTRLSLVESGFEQLAGSEEVRRRALTDNADGWREILASLKERLEKIAE